MDLTSLTRQPYLVYVPEVTAEDEPVVDLLANAAVEEAKLPISAVVADVRLALETEIARLDELKDAIFASVADVKVPVPDEYREAVGKAYLTRSDYVDSLSGRDYGPVMVQEIYESYNSGSHNQGEPAYLLLPDLMAVRDSMRADIEALADPLLSDDYARAQGSLSGDPRALQMLSLLKQESDDSKDLRLEILRTGKAYSTGLRTDWASVLSFKKELLAAHDTIDDMVALLTKVRAALKFAFVLRSVDWDSLRIDLRNYLTNMLIDIALRQVFSLYSRARTSVFDAVSKQMDSLRRTQKYMPKDNRMVMDTLGKVIEEASVKCMDSLTDLFLRNRKKSGLMLKSTQNVKSMMFTRGLIKKLDTLIDTLTQVADGLVDPEVFDTLDEDIDATHDWTSAIPEEHKDEVGFDETDIGDGPDADTTAQTAAADAAAANNAAGEELMSDTERTLGDYDSGYLEAWNSAQRELLVDAEGTRV